MPLRCRPTLVLALLASLLQARADPPKLQPLDPKVLQGWREAGLPVAAHDRLKAYVGTWITRQSDWQATGSKWNEADGTATCRLLLGGRFLQEDYTTTLDGQPFHTMTILGFDRTSNAYVFQWMNDLSTGLVLLEGQYDAAGRILTLLNGPLTSDGKPPAGWRVTDTWWDNDHHAVAWWGQSPIGEPMKMSEILYTRSR